MADDRKLTYTSPLGPVTIHERIAHARARVRNARLLAELHPEDRVYAVALDARRAELESLERCLL